MIEHVFPCMGTTVQALLPVEDAVMIDFVTARLHRLENLWSRFNPESDISQLALGGGRSVSVEPETVVLVEHLLRAHRMTDGFFDPTILPALITAGYSTSTVDGCDSVVPPKTFEGSLNDVAIDFASNEVMLPPGMTLDAGGLGKGLAADLVVRDLVDMGVKGASISVGGDVSFAGSPDDGDNWVVTVGAPRNYSEVIATVRARGGGVATSTLAAREWNVDGEHRHHVIDPRTRRPVETTSESTLQAAVIAGSAADAEAFATALTVCDASTASDLIDRHCLSALMLLNDGTFVKLGSWDAYL